MEGLRGEELSTELMKQAITFHEARKKKSFNPNVSSSHQAKKIPLLKTDPRAEQTLHAYLC